MQVLSRSVCGLVALIVSGASSAQSGPAPDELSVSVAARMFVNRISGVGYGSTGVPGLNPNYANISSSTCAMQRWRFSVGANPTRLSCSGRKQSEQSWRKRSG